VLRSLVDGCEISLLSLGGEPPKLQVYEHTVSESSHRHPPVRVSYDPDLWAMTNRKIGASSKLRKRKCKARRL
jgi:hypothetical protein